MKNVFQGPKLLWWLLCLFCFVITAAWQRDDEIKQDSTSNYNGNRDTTRPGQRNYDKNEFTVKDIEDAMKRTGHRTAKMNIELKNINIEVSKI